MHATARCLLSLYPKCKVVASLCYTLGGIDQWSDVISGLSKGPLMADVGLKTIGHVVFQHARSFVPTRDKWLPDVSGIGLFPPPY